MSAKANTQVRVDQDIYEDVRQVALGERPRKRTITDMVNVLLAEALAARRAARKARAGS